MYKLFNTSVLKLTTLFLIFSFIIEGLNKINTYFLDSDFYIQKGLKFFILIVCLFYIAAHQIKNLVNFFILILCFIIGQFVLETSFLPISFIALSRYLFFVLLIIFAENKTGSTENLTILKKVFESIIGINSIIIIISFLFNIELFKTYSGERFGFNGLFMASSNSTYFYLLTLIYFFTNFHFKKLLKTPIFWLCIVSSMLIGTKTIYLGYLFIISTQIFFSLKSFTHRIIIISSCIFSILVGAYFFIKTAVFSQIISEKGFISAFLSLRNDLFIERTIPYIEKNWTILNYFFGGISNISIRPQIELIDLYLMFGAIGVVIFLYIFIVYYMKGFVFNKCLFVNFSILFLAVLFSGNFFYNATVPIYLISFKFLVANNSFLNSSNYA